jgi:DmsE family decaheme c-type cytochrome
LLAALWLGGGVASSADAQTGAPLTVESAGPVSGEAPSRSGGESAGPEEPKVAKPKAPRKPRVDLVMKGDGECTRCHDESDDYPVLSIAQTRHGVRADERTPTCVSCHGESEKHMRAPKGGGGDRPPTDFPFGKKVKKDIAKHNARCAECHQGDKLILWLGSTHSRRDVACSQCHTMHTPRDPALDRMKVADMCMNCHTEKIAYIKRPSRHPTLEGKVTCIDCHAPHGSAGPKLMVKDSVVATCYTCHMEKRGPFLWNHLPVTQDCSICHNPHGSVNPNLLKLRPPFLCQQCHEPTSHRGNLPTLFTDSPIPSTPSNPFASGTAAGGNRVPAQARACLNCHNNTHGGNNATNVPNSGRLRR